MAWEGGGMLGARGELSKVGRCGGWGGWGQHGAKGKFSRVGRLEVGGGGGGRYISDFLSPFEEWTNGQRFGCKTLKSKS